MVDSCEHLLFCWLPNIQIFCPFQTSFISESSLFGGRVLRTCSKVKGTVSFATARSEHMTQTCPNTLPTGTLNLGSDAVMQGTKIIFWGSGKCPVGWRVSSSPGITARDFSSITLIRVFLSQVSSV